MAVVDTRVLIDVSGSMWTSDPDNLRVPALKLFIELLPETTRAGVWIFGRDVTMQVPFGEVNADWKTRALDLAEGIHSRGLYTNIEAALEIAMHNWESTDGIAERNLVLLTGGVVDVDGDEQLSLASKRRILSDLVPRLEAAGAAIFAIGLSDKADHQLMRELAAGTGGRYQKLKDASGLDRLFFRLFESAVSRDSLPLTENRFTVDSAVDEFTMLVFRAPGASPSRLIQPDGSVLEHKKATASLRWQRTSTYDLITVKQPTVGEWQVEASVDADNRVMIVTDSSLELGALPSAIIPGEPVSIDGQVVLRGLAVDDLRFLNLVEISTLYMVNGMVRHAQPVEARRDGSFVYEVDTVGVEGNH